MADTLNDDSERKQWYKRYMGRHLIFDDPTGRRSEDMERDAWDLFCGFQFEIERAEGTSKRKRLWYCCNAYCPEYALPQATVEKCPHCVGLQSTGGRKSMPYSLELAEELYRERKAWNNWDRNRTGSIDSVCINDECRMFGKPRKGGFHSGQCLRCDDYTIIRLPNGKFWREKLAAMRRGEDVILI